MPPYDDDDKEEAQRNPIFRRAFPPLYRAARWAYFAIKWPRRGDSLLASSKIARAQNFIIIKKKAKEDIAEFKLLSLLLLPSREHCICGIYAFNVL